MNWAGSEWHTSRDGGVSRAGKRMHKSLLSRQGSGSLEEAEKMGIEKVNMFKIHLGATAAVLGRYGITDMEVSEVISSFWPKT